MHCAAEESLRCNFVRRNGEILAISQKQLHGAQRYTSFSLTTGLCLVLRVKELEASLNSSPRTKLHKLIEGDSSSFASVSRGHCRLFLSVSP